MDSRSGSKWCQKMEHVQIVHCKEPLSILLEIAESTATWDTSTIPKSNLFLIFQAKIIKAYGTNRTFQGGKGFPDSFYQSQAYLVFSKGNW